ncbi:C-type mannose receptor 2-like, partial [Hydra vulgaris]|uniref:C-type mannose receptor 2-like n=1 Tax=Hydra vulgaris TaxID=6087 RepID=UPI0032EA1778
MHYWIGLNSYPMMRNFSWSDNTTLNFTNWISGEPNNANNDNEACAAAKYNGWIDYICQATLNFICKAKIVNWSGWSEWSTSNQNCIKTRTRSCNSNQWLSCSGESVIMSSDIFCKEFTATTILSSTIAAITSLELDSTILVLSPSLQSSFVSTPLYSSTKSFSSVVVGEFSAKPFFLSAISAITNL